MADLTNLEDIRTRLSEEAQNFTKPLPTQLRALEPFKDQIRALRTRQASFRDITALLKKHGVDVSHDTVFRFCRQILKEKPARPVSPRNQSASAKIGQQRAEHIRHLPAKQVGPHIADSKNL